MQSLSALKERKTGCSEQLTITSVIHYRCSQVSKCTNKESVKHLSLSPLISEGKICHIINMGYCSKHSAVTCRAVQTCSRAASMYLFHSCASLPPPKKRKNTNREKFWYLNELQMNGKSQAIN